MNDTPNNPPVVDKPNTVASLVITCDVATGRMTVAGHVENTPLVLRMCIGAANLIMERNAAKDNAVGDRPPLPFPGSPDKIH